MNVTISPSPPAPLPKSLVPRWKRGDLPSSALGRGTQRVPGGERPGRWLLALLCAFLSATALAQKPEAQVLCVPGLPGRWQVTVSVQKDEPKAALDARMKALTTALGGKSGAQSTQKIAAGPVTLSTLSFVTTAPLAKADGSLVLEPFILALREFSRVQITYNVPDVFTYTGSPRFETGGVLVTLTKQPGALNFMAEIANHQVTALPVPLAKDPTPAPTRSAPGSGRILGALLVILLALGAGLVAFGLLARRNAR